MQISLRTAIIASVVVLAAIASLVYPLIKQNKSLEESLLISERNVISARTEAEKLRETIKNYEKQVRETITKPDGTVIVREEIIRENTKVSEKETVKKDETSVSESKKETHKKVNADVERYSVTVYRSTDFSGAARYSADIGARIGNLPFEGVALTTDSGRDFYIGVRYRW